MGKIIHESDVEAAVIRGARNRGGIAYKFVSPGHSGVPDRLQLLPINNPVHRAIVAEYVRFVECKAPGKKLRPDQRNETEYLRSLGYCVVVVDSL